MGIARTITPALLCCYLLLPGIARAEEPTLDAQFVDSGESFAPIPNQRAAQFSETAAADVSFELEESDLSGDCGCSPCDDDCGCECPKCDCKKQKELAKAVASAYKPLFYDNNFDYLCDPCYDDWWPGDRLKRNCLGDCAVVDFGGQYRLRYQNEQNFRGITLNGRDDSFLLQRARVYSNVEIGERFRVFAEFLSAASDFEAFPPRPIEESYANMENLFGDAMLWDGDRGDVWARIGRQELLYGQQRSVSPLDWANTRRTFDGGKLFSRGEKWDIDAFWTHPVPPVEEVFLSADESQEFSGVWAKYKDLENETLDLYYLRYIETDGAGFEYNTFGGVYYGSRDNWLWDLWAAYQFGEVGTADQSAWAFTAGGGYKFSDVAWTPTVWAFYDWAEGSDQPGLGYNHLFPLAHKYLGWMDLYGRRNIEDLNFLLTVQPTEKLKLFAWWHIFRLQNTNDVPYTVVMTPSVPTPGGDPDLGQELDLLAAWQMNARTELVLGYSHYFTGPFYRTNPSPPPFSGDADFYYTQLTFNF